MKRMTAVMVLAFALPGLALAATRTYPTGAFDSVTVSSGVEVDITIGGSPGVSAETATDSFDDLQIAVESNVLRISRPARNWLASLLSGGRPEYHVRVVTTALRSLTAASGSEVTVKGVLAGDFSVSASSGSDVEVSAIKGGNVEASASSGSDLNLSGTCITLEASASSGSDVDADDLQCEDVKVEGSSGSDIAVAATKSVTGSASSGSDIRIRSRPAVVRVDASSGAKVHP